ncbi:MAG: hypothetical protein J6C15_04850 [Bacteroidaceae bacterium]|nr:hypothetical protein [Bacteroidaceae bacterium]
MKGYIQLTKVRKKTEPFPALYVFLRKLSPNLSFRKLSLISLWEGRPIVPRTLYLDYLRKFKNSERADKEKNGAGGAQFFFCVRKSAVAFTEFFFLKAEENFSLY